MVDSDRLDHPKILRSLLPRGEEAVRKEGQFIGSSGASPVRSNMDVEIGEERDVGILKMGLRGPKRGKRNLEGNSFNIPKAYS